MKRILILLMALAILGCKDRSAHHVPPVTDIEQDIDVFPTAVHTEWQSVINSDSLKILYHPQAYKVFPDGTYIKGQDAINKFYQDANLEIGEVYSDTLLTADKNGHYAYEIGGFLTKKGQPYKHLIIWNLQSSIPVRELEMFAETEFYQPALKEIDNSRREWVRYCNTHDAKALVNAMYIDSALYYNHKPMVIGQAALTEEYAYMNQASYNLDLTPLYSAQVSDELVYEIGQCSGSYNGKYVIVWEKQADNRWKVFLDSNK